MIFVFRPSTKCAGMSKVEVDFSICLILEIRKRFLLRKVIIQILGLKKAKCARKIDFFFDREKKSEIN